MQLQSDLVAGAEVDVVEVVLRDESGAHVATRALALTSGRSLGRPMRIAEIRDLAPGTYDVRVTLSLYDLPVQSRPARVRVSGATFLTLLMVRDCNGVTCPGAGDATATACLGGRCVPPECTEETPELCGPPACTDDGECAAGAVACVAGRCSPSGACFAAADDALCEGALVCDATSGCVEAGTCPTPELPSFVTDCADAVVRAGDADGDGLSDATDPDPATCNALVAMFDGNDRPDAPWSDPMRAACAREDGDETSAVGDALGLAGIGAIVRARFAIGVVSEGGAGVTLTTGTSTVVCEAGELGAGQMRVGRPDSGTVLSLPYSVTGMPVLVQMVRRATAPMNVSCIVANRDESTVSSPNETNGLDATAAAVGFDVHGASVTLDYVAVFEPAPGT